MELWIRSQDKKKLFNAKSFELDNCQNGIFCNYDTDYYIFAGKYKSKERALEVLDEIQHRLITLCDSMNRHLYVYEMPKE